MAPCCILWLNESLAGGVLNGHGGPDVLNQPDGDWVHESYAGSNNGASIQSRLLNPGLCLNTMHIV